MKRTLVTGAAGFIGYHTLLALHRRGDDVVGLDNFNDYYDKELKRARAAHVKELGIPLIEGDVCDAQLLGKLVDDQASTHVVHLAAQAGVRYSLENPQAYVRANLEGFVNVLEVCRRRLPIRLIYASSSSVYGLNREVPFSVDQRTDHQASLYGVTKKTNELMASTYHHLYGLHTTGLRFFTVYGPWGRPDMAYYSFAGRISRGEPIDVFNHGKMERDFTYIDDIVKGIIAAVDLSAPCEIFNLGNHRPEKLETLIEVLEAGLGCKAQRRMQPMQPGDVVATYADVEHSRRLLGYEPTTSLEVGMSHFLNWYRAHGSRYKH